VLRPGNSRQHRDLGLIYDCHLTSVGENSFKADVKMTLTAPGCGMGPALAQDVQNKLLSLEPIDEANVELVWDRLGTRA